MRRSYDRAADNDRSPQAASIAPDAEPVPSYTAGLTRTTKRRGGVLPPFGQTTQGRGRRGQRHLPGEAERAAGGWHARWGRETRAAPRGAASRSALQGTKAKGLRRPSRGGASPPIDRKRPSDGRSPGMDPGPQGAFEVSMINVSCNSHYFSQLAAFFIDARAE